MKKASAVLILTLLVFSLASAASQDPRHPLSQIHPTDTNFNMSGYQVFNASAFEIQEGLNFSRYGVYDQGGVKLLEWNENNGKWDFTNSDIEMVNGNIQMNGNNITEIDTLHFLSGMKINGSINMSGGDVNLDDGSIKDVYSIDGGGDEVNFLGPIDTNGNIITNSGGKLNLGGNVRVGAGHLDMAENNIINPGNVNGVDLDNPGNGLGITSSRYKIISDAIGNSELNNSQEFTVQGLNVSGGNITEIDTLKFEEGTSIDGNISINGSINTTGEIDLNDDDIDDVRSIDGGGDSVRLDDIIDMSSNRITDLADPTNAQDATTRSWVNSNDDTIADNQTLSEVLIQGKSAGSNNINLPNGQFLTGNRDDGATSNLIGYESGTQDIVVGEASTRPSNLKIYTPTDQNQGVAIHNGSARVAYFDVGGNVEVPNGDLTVGGGNIVFGSTDIAESDIDALDDGVIQNGEMANSALTVTAGNQLTGGGSISLGGSTTINLNEGSGSGLDADMLDGVQLANINWGDTSMAQSDVNISDLGAADSNLDMNGYSVTNYFSSPCSSGQAIVDVNDDGTFQCMDVSDEVSSDYVNRSGDSMTGNLDMTGNSILDIGGLGGSSIVNSGNINGGAVGSSELASNAVTSSGGELDSTVAGNQITYNAGSLGVNEGSGSGLNADQLDGEHLQDILNDENNEVSGTDWNTLTEPGIYGVAKSGSLNSSLNQPSSAYSYGHLIVTEGGGSNGLMQMYVSHHSASNGAFWVRTGWSDGSWDAWQAIPTRSWVNNNDDTGTDDQTLGEVLDQGSTANQNIGMNNNDITGINGLSIGDAGTDGDIIFGSGARIYNAPLDDSNNDGYLQIVNDGGIAFEPSTDGTTAAEFNTNNNLDMKDNKISNLNLQNVNGIEMDGDIYGGGFDMSLQEVGTILGPNNGETDLNIQTQGGGSHVVSIEDGSSSNVDIARFEEGTQNVVIPNGNLGIGTSPSNTVDLNTGSNSDGISFDGQTALSGYSGNGWLRLNQDNQFSNGVYTPGYFRADGGGEFQGNLDMSNNAIINVDWANSDQPPGSTDDQTLGTSGNQITIENGNSITAPYANNADQLDGVQLANINWGDTSMAQSDVSVSDLGAADANLNMNNYNVNSVSTINNGGSTVNTGGTINIGSGSVTASQRMCIGDRCA